MTRQQRNWNILTIYLVAALQMGGAGLSPVLKELSNAFPAYSTTAIQFVMTIPSITVALTSLLTGWLCERFPKKYLIAIGCALAIAFALLGCFFHSALWLIYVWAAILGVGTALSCTVSPAIVNEMFEPDERVGIFGVRACASSIGTMLMTFVGGYLVSVRWQYGFLVYLIMVPGLVLTLLVHPKDTKLAKTATERASNAPMDVKALLFPCLCGLTISMFYSVAMVNASMLVAESGVVASEVAAARGGLLSTTFLAVGGLAGFLLNRLTKRLGLHCMTLGYLLIAIGYAMIFSARSYGMLIAAAVVCGGAITLVMPHVQILSSDAGGKRHELGLSIALVCANLGTLASPLLTETSRALFKTDAVRYRFLLVSGIAAVVCMAVAAKIIYDTRKTKNI